MNLLISDFYRIIKDKVLYILLGALGVLTFLVCLVFSYLDLDPNNPVAVGSVMMECLGVGTMGTIIGIGVALFCGKDYENNTIRNKICCGESRYKIYFAKLIESLVLATVFYGFTMLCCTIFGAFFFEFTAVDEFWAKIFSQLLIVLAFTSLITCLCVTTKSTKATIIFTVVQFVVLNALGRMLPNMGDGFVIKAVCRSLYFTFSAMMLASKKGLYTVSMFSNGQMQVVEYANMYLNVILASLMYIVIAVAVSLLIVRKQEYK